MAGVGFAQVLLMAVAGGLGAVARWGADTWLKRRMAPLWSLTCINVLGSFLLGLCVVGFADSGGEELIIGTGFLGGFTTFSTVMVETVGSGVGGSGAGSGAAQSGGASAGAGGTTGSGAGSGAAVAGVGTEGARRRAHHWGTLAWGTIGMLLLCVLAFLAGLTLGAA